MSNIHFVRYTCTKLERSQPIEEVRHATATSNTAAMLHFCMYVVRKGQEWPGSKWQHRTLLLRGENMSETCIIIIITISLHTVCPDMRDTLRF